MSTCLIDCGGGYRGVYGAGIMERCLDDDVYFDGCIGISAGSANVITYLAKQKGRLYKFYHDYAFRKEYKSLYSFLKTGNYLGLDYIYGTLSNSDGECPLDYETAARYTGNFELVTTNAQTGQPVYLTMDDLEKDNYWIFKASCALPIFCKPVVQNNIAYMDGGIADPIPIDHALDSGYDKIVLVLTKPAEKVMEPTIEHPAALLTRSKYPQTSRQLLQRADRYNASLDKAKKLAAEGRCLILSPSETFGVETVKSSPKSADLLYHKAYEDAAVIQNFIHHTNTKECVPL